MGVVAIALTFLSLVSLPFLSGVHVGSPKFRVISERLFWVFGADVFLLTWLGAQEIAPATVTMGILCTLILFAYLVIVYPLLSVGENNLYLTWASGPYASHTVPSSGVSTTVGGNFLSISTHNARGPVGSVNESPNGYPSGTERAHPSGGPR